MKEGALRDPLVRAADFRCKLNWRLEDNIEAVFPPLGDEPGAYEGRGP